jgi:hypothetical protein
MKLTKTELAVQLVTKQGLNPYQAAKTVGLASSASVYKELKRRGLNPEDDGTSDLTIEEFVEELTEVVESKPQSFQQRFAMHLIGVWLNKFLVEPVQTIAPRKRDLAGWTFEEAQAIAESFYHEDEWRKKHRASYEAIQKLGWLDILSFKDLNHEAENEKGSFHDNYGACYIDYKYSVQQLKNMTTKVSSRKHWKKEFGDSYYLAKKLGLLDEIKPLNKRPPNYWNYERCEAEAKNFSSPSDWYQKATYLGGYYLAKKSGWLPMFFPDEKPQSTVQDNFG